MTAPNQTVAVEPPSHAARSRSRVPAVITIALVLVGLFAVVLSPLGEPVRTLGGSWSGFFAEHEERLYTDVADWEAEEDFAFKKETDTWLPEGAADITLRVAHDAQGWALRFASDAGQPSGCIPVEATTPPRLHVEWLPEAGTSGWECDVLNVQGTADGFAAWMP
ncbi:hypothetical protein I2485_14380 [Nesterenkonia sp. E16_7]|uniref:hypothetical protein n=1 Tax=unclassified Nesterenkonia TaxID=2629769 RepID=UPI001A919064|nr:MULTISPECIES: hypothetical protein [unclassified Nesterenkonia]MBO0594897.1 hypothetical protein [Nesterenkonia sp. E16_10]MBO0599833.1 hypothetical protein [Nesterenkonia sp. E16_7]